jgi:nitrile hydratase subunit beta
MNGVHDMGGMHGLGPITPEREGEEPLFHAPWEARVLAINLAVSAWGRTNLDAWRHARERIPGPDYLRMGYYEKWLTALLGEIVEQGLVTADELAAGLPAPGAAPTDPALKAADVAGVLARGGPAQRPAQAPPALAVGDRVRARNIHPDGHTRLPRYVRGHQGVITAHHGTHVFPDSNAHGLGEDPRHLYQVRFEAAELWGPDAGGFGHAGRGAVYLDLWEPYLEPA